MIAKITKKLVDQVHPGLKDILVFDTDLKGFTLKVTPAGTKTYQVIYRMGGRATAKQKITIGKHGSPWTADAARTEAEKLLGQVGQMIDPAADRKASLAAAFTVAALADRYLIEHVATKNKPSTLAEVRRQVERIIKPRLGACAVAAVTRGDIAALHHALRTTPRQANHVLAVLSKMFTLAELWGFRPETTNPCRLIQRYKESKRERFLSTAEVADLAETLATLEDNRQEMDSVLNAVRLLLLTGCRLGEMLALRWEDIDLEAGTLTIRDAKAGARRHSIGAQTIALLKDLPHHSDWVLTGTAPHRSLPRATLEGAWSRIRAAANLADVRLHDLRHTVGTYAGQTGANAFLVRDKLGHKTLAMTGRYVNRDADPLRALSDAVEDRIMTALKNGTGRRKGGEVPTDGPRKP